MDVNGNNLVQLTDHPASDLHPACSPDGRRIAFASGRGVTHDLYVMDSDGTNVIRLTGDNFEEDLHSVITAAEGKNLEQLRKRVGPIRRMGQKSPLCQRVVEILIFT